MNSTKLLYGKGLARCEMIEDRCVACGEIIPEGMQVCGECNRIPTQKDRVLALLKEGWTDQLTALREAGVMRLASRVNDLKRDGYPVESRMKEVKNRWGESCYVKEYRIIDTDQEKAEKAEQLKKDIKTVILKLAEAFAEERSNDE